MPLNTRKHVAELHEGDSVRLSFNDNAVCPVTMTVRNTSAKSLVFKVQNGEETRPSESTVAYPQTNSIQSNPGYRSGVTWTDARPDGLVYTRPNAIGVLKVTGTTGLAASLQVNGEAVAGTLNTANVITDAATAQTAFDTAFGADNTNVLKLWTDSADGARYVVFEWIGLYGHKDIALTGTGTITGGGHDATLTYEDGGNEVPEDAGASVTVPPKGTVSLSYSVNGNGLLGPYVRIVTTSGHGFAEIATLDASNNLIEN